MFINEGGPVLMIYCMESLTKLTLRMPRELGRKVGKNNSI